MHSLSVLTPWLSRAGGGLQSSVRDLVLAIDKLSLVDVSTYGIKDSYFDEDIKYWAGAKVFASDFYGPESFRFSPGLISNVLSINPDFLQLHGIWMCPGFSVRLKNFFGKNPPYMISPHGMMDEWIVSRNKWKKSLARFVWEDSLWDGASIIRALNIDEARSVRKILPNKPICVIPNGVESISDARYNEALNYRKGRPPVLLFLGRLHEKKQVVELVRAWNLFKSASKSEWRLAIAGWGESKYVDLLTNIINSDASGSIDFVGPVFGDKKQDILKSASAFILPSLSEGLPVAVLEACAYGAVPLITEFCNLPELIENDVAIRIDVNVDGIVSGLNFLNEVGSSELEAVGASARDFVARNYDWSKIAQSFVDVQEWICSGEGRPDSVLDW